MGTTESPRGARKALPAGASLESLNHGTPVPTDRGTGKNLRSRLGLQPRRFPVSRKLCGTLSYWASSIEGGKEAFIYLCELAAIEGSTPCDAMVTKYLSLSKTDRRNVTLDDLAEALDLRPSHVIRDVAETMAEHSLEGSKLLAYLAQPAVVRRLFKNAQKPSPDFHNDRKLALSATRFVQPTPLVNLDMRKGPEKEAVPDGSGMESFEDRIRRGAQTLRKDEG